MAKASDFEGKKQDELFYFVDYSPEEAERVGYSNYSYWGSVIQNFLKHKAAVVCLSLASIAGYALWTRRYMVDELTRDYIKLARVKGLSSSEIMFKHVLRNAMVPMVQYIPQSILLTVGGSLLMERFFSVPGMGPLLTDAIQRYDLNVVQTLVILYAVLGIVGVFMGDVLMMLVDPRITLTGKEAAR